MIAGTSFSVPVVLNTEADIWGIDILIDYDSTVLNATGATLSGGFLDGKSYLIVPNTAVAGKVNIRIYPSASAIKGKGDAVFVNFTITGSLQNAPLISLSKFDVNEAAGDGGLRMSGSACQNVKIKTACDPNADDKIGLEDAVYYLQCIAGLRQNCTCEATLEKVIQLLRILSGL
ncbi:MAG: hypothetical protein BWK80_60040 [Desulfobacteraceae bacterium IS3]|nr:MAG: hypothetical protein BWK80_60040 [Desulfobacteraceae bacterium IS3]